ncbi:MAG TPA: phosphoglycolate phosphatase [Plasticicumulans sp.]|uniref:phosphoglycolate phosphatase n=1 Tax=Plasticicumulans sp. TaxID=2307179 RepID=UPI002B77D77A|nr:phosphoglycolate phosphatase [Plasticicumulans sp.]HNE01155.1 phosphoglycolate phosphatase [Plasticicumulans sp.]HNG50709.1 phosphoglycolate phosphatase [Plasticicumulans sp.]HNK32817.1 phosphoglycolate phosphatase [Plasticicumulans sp.]
MFSHVDAILFDLDGTLIDSVPDIAVAIDQLMDTLDLPRRGEAKVRQWVGNGSTNLIRRALSDSMDGEADPELMDRAKPLYRRFYGAQVCVHSRLYPGVVEGLDKLAKRKRFKLACVTNKPADLAAPLLERIGIAHHFHALVGGECTPTVKPAPECLLLAASRIGVHISRCLMVGDSRNDIGAARNAGCPVVAVPYGYNHGRDIREFAPDIVIDSLSELSGLID